MGKLSQLHAELTEQAAALGFESLGEAEQAGYGVDWDNFKLIEPEEAAHKAWLKEKKKVLEELGLLLHRAEWADYFEDGDEEKIKRIIKFIEGVSHE